MNAPSSAGPGRPADPLQPFFTLPFVRDHGRWQDWWVLPDEARRWDAAVDVGEGWAADFIAACRQVPDVAGVPLYAVVCGMTQSDALMPRALTRDGRTGYAMGFFHGIAAELQGVRHG